MPGFDMVVDIGNEQRAASGSLGLEPGEDGLSCSLIAITSPDRLLEIESKEYSAGWRVAKWDIAQLPPDLEVIHKPTDKDPGHCIIIPKHGSEYTMKLQRKLAKLSRIIKK